MFVDSVDFGQQGKNKETNTEKITEEELNLNQNSSKKVRILSLIWYPQVISTADLSLPGKYY
jgi:hypothetical protein